MSEPKNGRQISMCSPADPIAATTDRREYRRRCPETMSIWLHSQGFAGTVRTTAPPVRK